VPQVVAVEFHQVESIQEYVGVMGPVADAIEARNPVLAACDRLPATSTWSSASEYAAIAFL